MTMTTARRCIIEAMDDTHEWDSDYVGNQPYTVDVARTYVHELEGRAANDPVEGDDCPDGISWAGWVFRIFAEDGDGCYCVPVATKGGGS